MSPAAWLYAGRVVHVRHTPFRHSFDYRVWMMAVDLDRVDEVAAGSRLFSHNRTGLISLVDRDHGNRDGTPLRRYVEAALARADLPPAARIVFVFMPRLLGYAFNPIGFYFCFDTGGRLFAVLHQVKNTFGGQIGYIMPVSGDRPILQTAPKRMHVSPFFDCQGGYRFALTPPGESLNVTIHYGMEEQPRMTAALALRARPFSSRSLLRLLAQMPFAPMKVMIAIHWQALKLFLAGAVFHRAPAADHDQVIVGDGERT